MCSISEETVEAYVRDGAVCIRGGVSAEWVHNLRKGLETNFNNPGIGFESLQNPGEGAFWNDYCNWREISEFREFIENSGINTIAAQLLNTTSPAFYHEHVLVKEPGTSKETPWHHDQPYYPFDGPLVSLWMALDPVPLASSLRFVKSSHRWGKSFIPRKFETLKEYKHQPAEVGSKYHKIPKDIDQSYSYEILSWDSEPGDLIAFDGLTLHAAHGNMSVIPRRVVTWRFLSPHARLVERPWEISPPVTGGMELGQTVLEANEQNPDDFAFPI